MECFGFRQLPEGAIAIEKVTRYGVKLLDRVANRQSITDNERRYVQYVVDFLNAVLWEQTAHPDYIRRGMFDRSRGELAYRMSVWWFALTTHTEWVPRMHVMRDVASRVVADGMLPADYVAISEVIGYLRGVNTVVSRTYNV